MTATAAHLTIRTLAATMMVAAIDVAVKIVALMAVLLTLILRMTARTAAAIIMGVSAAHAVSLPALMIRTIPRTGAGIATAATTGAKTVRARLTVTIIRTDLVSSP